VSNITKVHIQPLMQGTTEILDESRLGTLLSDAEKDTLDVPREMAYEYARLNLDAIPFSMSNGMAIHLVPGAFGSGVSGNYYEYVGEDGVAIDLGNEDFTNTSRWINRGPSDAVLDNDITIYDSNVTDTIRNALLDKFFVIKPVELEAPSFTYQNLGNLLLEQRDKVIDWIISHGTNAEAVARYQVQLELINEALESLGLLEPGGMVQRSLDVLFVELPDIYANPGSIFIQGDTVNGSSSNATLLALQAGGTLSARAGAQIEILNESPFTMVVNDAVIRDTKRVALVDGDYKVLQPGNVYFIGDGVTSNSDTALKTVTITQNAFPSGDFDIDIDTPSLPQDIYIVGSIINEVGSVTIVNLEGSITVTGEIRAATVDIQAVGDFSLNTDDWEHIGPDPREYLTFDDLAAAARLDAILGDGFLSFGSAASVNDGGENLDTKINNDPSRIVSQGQVAITARYLNINGLIQSGVQTVTLHVDGSFSPNPTGTLVSANGTPVTGVSFGAEGGVVDAFFDHAKQAIVVDDLCRRAGE
jgi:hypothetical protein